MKSDFTRIVDAVERNVEAAQSRLCATPAADFSDYLKRFYSYDSTRKALDTVKVAISEILKNDGEEDDS